jgi:thiamine biosynthesis lipoprotein
MNFKKSIYALVFLFVVVSCNKKEKLKQDYQLRGGVFGTSYNIKYLKATKNYQKEIDSLFSAINKSLSTYISTSDISRINAGDTTVLVDNYFLEVLEKSKRIHKETNGFFDPTVGNLVNAWGFGPKKEKKNLSKEQIEEQLKYVGLDKVAIKGNRILKKYPEVYLDFNSIAKGYGIDVIGRFLEDKKVENYLVEIGGEIRTKGTKPNKVPWTIKLVDPLENGIDDGFKVIDLSNKSMATSGNYLKYRISESGKKYVHTINPKTGEALENNLLSVSVIASLDCADVDAYATAFMAMGLEKTLMFLTNRKDIKVILLYVNKKNELQEYTNYYFEE